MTKDEVKALINAQITTNGTKQITGSVLNAVLLAMLDIVATPLALGDLTTIEGTQKTSSDLAGVGLTAAAIDSIKQGLVTRVAGNILGGTDYVTLNVNYFENSTDVFITMSDIPADGGTFATRVTINQKKSTDKWTVTVN